MLQALAPAKVNLCLHVGPVDPSGYHPLVSLVAFADVGDWLTIERADRLSLTVAGPFGGALGDDPDNLVLRALRRLGEVAGIGEPRLRVTLDKRLPIAAGLGGGSSDAGAAIGLAVQLLSLDLDAAALDEVASSIGADGPMCLHSRSAWAEGRGDVLTPAPWLPPLHAVLVNPGAPSPTGAVYRAYDAAPVPLDVRPIDPQDRSAAGVTDWLSGLRNDLQTPAVRVTSAIGAALDAVHALPGVRLTRMSGSGATVFGLFDDAETASAAAAMVSADHGDWWVQPTILGAEEA